MKSQGFSQTPQDIMEEYNGCSVPLYTAYPSNQLMYRESLCNNSSRFGYIFKLINVE